MTKESVLRRLQLKTLPYIFYLKQWFSTCCRDPFRGSELLLEGPRVDILCTQVYYNLL